MYTPKHKNEVLELMKGAYDLHTHTSPDFGARALRLLGRFLPTHLDNIRRKLMDQLFSTCP